MTYPEPYLPSEELIRVQKEELKQQHLLKMQANGSKNGNYHRPVINVPRDTRPVVGTNYQ